MGICLFDPAVNRRLQTANHNYHNRMAHPDRVMDVHDLVYVSTGGWRILEDGVEYEVMPGDAILLFAGNRHRGEKPCLPDTRTMYIHIYPHASDRYLPSQRAPRPDRQVAVATHMHTGGDLLIRSLFEKTVSAFWSSQPTRRQMASVYVTELLVELARRTGDEHERGEPWTDQAISRIEHEPSGRVQLDDLCRELKVSRRCLTKSFRKRTGKSIHQYQLDLRIRMASDLLVNTPTMSIKEIGYSLGFFDEYHFSKTFKARTGLCPSRYRQKHG